MKNIKENGINNETNLFPVTYKGKKYYEDDCDDVFLAFYNCLEALNNGCSVYVAGGMSVYPDGKMEEY